eukprot:267712_1
MAQPLHAQILKNVENPVIINIGVSQYDHDALENVEGVIDDMNKMEDLFHEFGFKKIYDNKKQQYLEDCDFWDIARDARTELNSNKKYDGIIISFCGYSNNENLLT